MKADKNGTYTEQARFRMGWQSPTELKVTGKKLGICCNCKSYWIKEIPNREGGAPNYSPYCGHPHAGGEVGHATRESARCDRWETSLK